MQKLATEIEGVINMTRDYTHLEEAAKKWACHCLSTYVGDLLSKGLKISEAIANFSAELIEDRK